MCSAAGGGVAGRTVGGSGKAEADGAARAEGGDV